MSRHGESPQSESPGARDGPRSAGDPPTGGSDPLLQAQQSFLTLLFNKYRGPLYRHLYRLVRSRDDADELVQESYFRLVRRSHTPEFEAVARVYLFQTATNLARDYFRRRTSHSSDVHVQIADDLPCGEHRPDQELIWQETLRGAKSAVLSMPHPIRTVFLLSRFRNRTYPQIAAQLGISTRTVERRMAVAMEMLASALRGTP